MIIYNVTVKIDLDIETDWQHWMKEVHIPDVMATGFFVDGQLRKLMYLEDDGVTYSIQYRCKTMEDLEAYQANHSQKLQEDHSTRYKDKYVAFRTLMHQIEEF